MVISKLIDQLSLRTLDQTAADKEINLEALVNAITGLHLNCHLEKSRGTPCQR